MIAFYHMMRKVFVCGVDIYNPIRILVCYDPLEEKYTGLVAFLSDEAQSIVELYCFSLRTSVCRFKLIY